MSYMQDLEARLKQLLAGLSDGEQAILIREIKTIALESYRNGQKASPAAATTPTQRRAAASTGTH